jgi:Transposase IS116/IS110/IS902 family/CHC2 zinc finger
LATLIAELPGSAHAQLQTIPGIGQATAAVLVAKIVDIDRFDTPDKLVGYFGIFPEENRSGVDRFGNPLPPGTMRMSRKGCDLVRGYLWNATRVAIRHNPAIRPLYRRLRAKGKRGDVAFGQCMRKLLHLVFAVWKTNHPFDAQHYPWENPNDEAPQEIAASSVGAPDSGNNKAEGHKQDRPAEKVVTSARSTIEQAPPSVKPEQPPAATRPHVDFAFLRQQVSLEQVLKHLDLLCHLRGSGPQRRGCCPLHSHPGDQERTFSVHLGKNAFRCFQKNCGAQGNALDLWAAIHRLPLYDAALHLAETFGLARNRGEETVKGTR